MFERFTDEATAVVRASQDVARSRGDELIGTEHLLLALVHRDTGIPFRVLADADVTVARIETALARATRPPTIVSVEDLAVLTELGIDAETILNEARAQTGAETAPTAEEHLAMLELSVSEKGHLRYGKKAKKVLENSLREAIQLRDNFIGTEHILLGLLRTDGLAIEVLHTLGVDLDDVAHRARGGRPLGHRVRLAGRSR